MALIATLLALRKDKRILKIPPYLSLLCILVGVAWLLLLPLNEYSRETYVSENALLPGQVHTYFTGSEHDVFRAYRHEVATLAELPIEERSQKVSDIFASSNLKVATQHYTYTPSNTTLSSLNTYAILRGPRADATEAIVLLASWTNFAGDQNTSGVALLLTLARYLSRFALWSKDIIFVVTGDSTTGPQAWVDAYHDSHSRQNVEDLKIKSGALQGAVALDYPAGPWGHRYEKLHIQYNGVNGALANLDLFNTAVQIAGGQMGIPCSIQSMHAHRNTYSDRLLTLFRGMLSQGLGHATGPHSAFIPYHVDAITISAVGDGWHDEMGLGRTVEGLVRSLNNLLEKLHQSFFFYLLLTEKRFVSIGTYLPSAMLIAANFSIMAIALWVKSGRPDVAEVPKLGATVPETTSKSASAASEAKKDTSGASGKTGEEKETANEKQAITLIHAGSDTAIIPTALLTTTERPLLTPILLTLSLHALGLLPLFLFNNIPAPYLPPLLHTTLLTSTLLPSLLSALFICFRPLSAQETTLIHCFTLLLLGMFLAALATLNFSLSFLVGLLCSPLSFIRASKGRVGSAVQSGLLVLLNPVVVGYAATLYFGVDGVAVLVKAAEGWHVWGLWTQVVVWLVWWPAWVGGSVVAGRGLFA